MDWENEEQIEAEGEGFERDINDSFSGLLDQESKVTHMLVTLPSWAASQWTGLGLS